ncbi:MAG: hypothetical protein KAS32_14440, partial [Candidatus Peribacteraceae bacterium]|nr:hypothetical protein [Candidatus Peribacteraceae bacterium]
KESTIKENIKEEIIIKDKENTKKKSPWCETIFKHWNSKNLIKHRSYPNSGKRTFNSITLGLSADCKLYEIMDAIDNYEMIVNDPKFYFRYRWGLADFLIRGFDNFKDKEIAVTNYLKSDVKILTEHEFAEITFRYERAFENVNDMIERGTADETDRDEIVEALKEQLKKFYIPKDLQQDLHNMAFGIPKL